MGRGGEIKRRRREITIRGKRAKEKEKKRKKRQNRWGD